MHTLSDDSIQGAHLKEEFTIVKVKRPREERKIN